MLQRPVITVVTVCRNLVSEIEATLLSVLGQDYPHLEYIVIDGGSTDGTAAVIERYAPRLAYWESAPDRGTFDAMNKGIAHAKGEYVLFMNGGDTFVSPRSLSLLVGKARTQADFIAGTAVINNPCGRMPWLWRPMRGPLTLERVAGGCICNHQATLARRSVLGSGYDLAGGLIADELMLATRVCLQGATYEGVDVPVSRYDFNGVSNDSRQLGQIEATRRQWYASLGIELPPPLRARRGLPRLLAKAAHRIVRLRVWMGYGK